MRFYSQSAREQPVYRRSAKIKNHVELISVSFIELINGS